VAAAETAPWPSQRAAIYLILVLTVANVFSYVDRIILNLMIGPIKQSFQISDTQVSLLQGLAFGVFYTIAALPIGRLVDYWDRRLIISLGGAVFSACTIACGLAQSFWQLFFARVGVGAGEASLGPAAYSLMADTYPKDKLSGAMGVYTMGAFVGIGLAYVFGGLVVQWALHAGTLSLPLLGAVEPWQTAFIAAGAPGLLVALWVLTLKEPARKGVAPGAPGAKLKPLPMREVLAHLGGRAGLYVPLFGGFCLITLSAYANTSWTPAFLGRVHGMNAGETGLTLGVLVLLFGTTGALAGGRVADWLARRGRPDAPVIAAMIGVGLAWLPGVIAPLAPTREGAIVALGVREFFAVFPFPLAAAAIQMVTPNQLRGQTTAVYFFAINMVGLGLGPTVTALLSDHVFTGTEGVRYSLAWVSGVAAPLALILLALARAPYRRAAAESDALERR
jgi:MFS family permease